MEPIDVRRGMARFGFVVLVLWEAFVIFSIYFLMVLDNPSVDVLGFGESAIDMLHCHPWRGVDVLASAVVGCSRLRP